MHSATIVVLFPVASQSFLAPGVQPQSVGEVMSASLQFLASTYGTWFSGNLVQVFTHSRRAENNNASGILIWLGSVSGLPRLS